MEENVFYKPGEPSSVMSLNEEVDLFASCVNIYTTETDVYGDIMDEPRELEVFDEGAWALNLATGIVATLGLAACAIAVVATGGAAVGALTGVGIMYAGPALTVAGEQAGFEASFLMGTNALTVSTIPDIVTAGGMTLLATDGAYVLNEINTMCTGQNLAVDTVFEGNEENYEACVVALQVLNEGLLDLTTRGYQRNGSGSSSSEAEKSDEGAEISESGVNIRGAGDETSYGKSSGKYDTTADFLTNIENRNGKFYTDKATIDKIGQVEARGEDFSLLNKRIMSSRASTEGGTSVVYKYSDELGTKYLIHEVTDARGYIIHRDFDAVRISSGQLINKGH